MPFNHPMMKTNRQAMMSGRTKEYGILWVHYYYYTYLTCFIFNYINNKKNYDQIVSEIEGTHTDSTFDLTRRNMLKLAIYKKKLIINQLC